jgi:adenylate cyclase
MDRITLLNRITPIIISLFIMFGMITFYLSDGSFAKALRDRMGWIIYDLRMSASLQDVEIDQASLPVTIVDVDEASLAELGHWPWPRDILAELTEKLADKGATLIAYDVLFAEEQDHAIKVIERYKKDNPLANSAEQDQIYSNIINILDGDKRFAEVVRNNEVALSIVFTNSGFTKGKLSQPLSVIADDMDFMDNMPAMDGLISSTDRLSEAANYVGFINAHPDADGIMRRARLVQNYNGVLYPSLSLISSMGFLLADDVTIHSDVIGDESYLQGIQLFDQYIPIDGNGDVLIPYLGPAYTFPYVSIIDVLNDTADPKLLEGKIILIGSTAASLSDFRATPTNSLYPGVEAHASVIAGIINNNFSAKPEWSYGINFVLIIIAGLILSLMMPFLEPSRQLLCLVLLLGSIITFDYWLWISQRFIIDTLVPILNIFLIGMFNLTFGFIINSRDRLQLKSMFGQYVPPELVDHMSKHPGEFAMDGQRKEMSVLFSDIRNFTSISEGLTAADLKQWLNTYFTPITEIIFNNKGTIDKYVGDMVMAFWGAPLDDKDHAYHSVVAAFEMLKKTETLKMQFIVEGKPPVDVGIGISSGDMNVGNMGSKYRRSYTVLGDTVNLGARLEGLTKFYGVKLIVAKRTTELIGERMTFRHLDRVRVKGKDEPVDIYEPLEEFDEVELASYDQAFEWYVAGEFEQALQAFSELYMNDESKKIYKLHMERCIDLKQETPADWQGVFTHQTK